MCRPTNTTMANANVLKRSPSRLLLTHDSFVFDEPDKDDGKKQALKDPQTFGLGGPNKSATLLTVAFYVAVLFLLEHGARYAINRYSHLSPILEVELNRCILARHLAIDFVCLGLAAYLGVTHRNICQDLILQGRSFGKSNSMSEDDYEDRVFKYHPGGHRLLMLFFIYQAKNMYDTIYWNDGPEFVVHHILAGVTAWAGMYPGCFHYYAIFYFGVSEISTAILCLLANFDDEHGVPGLGEAFPNAKLFLGVLFVISFIICRVIFWPFVTYYFSKDSSKVLKSDNILMKDRRVAVWIISASCAGLSFIQLIFLAQIVITGKKEIEKMIS